VIEQQLTIRNKSDFNPHQLLHTIDYNTLLSKRPTTKQSLKISTLHSALVLHMYFKDCTWPSVNTKTLLQQGVIHFRYNQERENLNKQRYYDSFKEDCTWISATSHLSKCTQDIVL
jgi:DNA polymerase-3 subunit alpha